MQYKPSPVEWTAWRSATSPGSTITATPGVPSACWIATRTNRGLWPALDSVSHQALASTNSRSGWVSWKKDVPIWAVGMCEASARTGAPLRFASYSPWMRCVLPGPQLPAHTASRPVT